MSVLDIVIAVAAAYLLMGVGFAIASWLQAAEIAANEKKPIPNFFTHSLLFTVAWLFIAIYCYRAEVKKLIPEIDFEKLNEIAEEKQKAKETSQKD